MLKPAFRRRRRGRARGLAADCADGPALGIGAPLAEAGEVYNAYAILQGGRVVGPRPEAPPAQLQRLRRAARVPLRLDLRTVPDRPAPRRHADLRGRLVRRRRRDAGRERRRAADGAERLAVPPRQVRRAHEPHGRARGRDRPAAGLSQHGRRPGRPGLRRRLLRAQPRRRRSRCSCRSFDETRRPCRLHRGSAGLAGADRRARRPPRARSSRTTARWSTGLRDYLRQVRLLEGAARPLRRRRQRAGRHHRRRRARARQRPLRDAALRVHLARQPRGRRRRRAGRSAAGSTRSRSSPAARR